MSSSLSHAVKYCPSCSMSLPHSPHAVPSGSGRTVCFSAMVLFCARRFHRRADLVVARGLTFLCSEHGQQSYLVSASGMSFSAMKGRDGRPHDDPDDDDDGDDDGDDY
jgi:hypothetical protein